MSSRIVFLDYTNGIGFGGGQRSLQLLIEELDRTRYEPVLICPPGERLLDLIPSRVRVKTLPLPPGFRGLSRRGATWPAVADSIPALKGTLSQLRRILIEERPALIHSNNMKMHLLASAASAGMRTPRLWHVRDILPLSILTGCLKRAAARASARVLAVSRAVARHLPPGAPVQVLYNAVRLPDVSRLAEWRRQYRLRLGIPAGTCLIGYCGRLDSGKGIDRLIDAFSVLHARRPDAGLLIAGEGPERVGLERLAREKGLGEAVRFTGFESDLNSVYSALDSAVAPSAEPDSFPRSVIEAMAHELPVIGTDVGGIPEAIENVTTGFVVPAGDAGALVRALEAVTTNSTLRRQQGRAGRQHAERRFSAEAQVRSLTTIYEELAPAS